MEGKDARKILESFPSFVTQTGKAMPLNACNRHLERCINSLLQEQVNSTAALETLQYFGDSAYYPLVVLAHACMLAHREVHARGVVQRALVGQVGRHPDCT